MRIERKNFFRYREATALSHKHEFGANQATASRQSVFIQSPAFYSLISVFFLRRCYFGFAIATWHYVSKMLQPPAERGLTSRLAHAFAYASGDAKLQR